MSEEKLYELLKDVTTPAKYWRAGQRETKQFWMKEFDMDYFCFKHSRDWFLDLTEQKEKVVVDELHELIQSVFAKKGLRSISYKEAAREVAEEYVKRKTSNELNFHETEEPTD